MTDSARDRHYRLKAELLQIFRRMGVPAATIAELDAQLPEVVDIDESGTLLQTYGLTRDEAMSRLGGSP